MLPALLLTAGLGTRLRPLTLARAKAAVPIAGEPLVRRLVRWLAAAGVTRLVLNLHHLPATITSVLGDGSDLGARIRYSWEQPFVLGSAGGPRRALPILGADTCLIVNGDTLTDVNVPALTAAHAASDALVTLALVPNREPLKYGGVRLDAASRVTGFVPRGPSADGCYHFIGVQVAHADAFRRVPADQAINSIGGVYDHLLASRPGSIRGFVTDAAFWDVGTISDYWSTSLAFMDDFHSRGAPPPRPTRPGRSPRAYPEPDVSRRHGRNVSVHPTARVGRSILWDDVEVGPNATLEDCIVADGVRVPPGASYRRSALVRTDEGLTVTAFD
jgi:NDP-sugar pyrophosphorylase family protein